MELTLQINNPDIERLLIEFIKQRKEDLKEISFETLEFFIKTFKRDNIKSFNKNIDTINQEDIDFQNISNISLDKIWNNQEDSVYDKFLE